jgi:hypothetical protein
MTKTLAMLALALVGCVEAHPVSPVLACDGTEGPGPVRWVRVGDSESVRIRECEALPEVAATAQQRAGELGCAVIIGASERPWCDYPSHVDLLMRIDGAQDCEALNETTASPCAMPIWRTL